MARYKLVALATPFAGREEEFAEWYQSVHMPEMVERFPGMTGAERYELVDKLVGEGGNQSLAIYDLEMDDPAAFMDAIRNPAQFGLTRSESSDRSGVYTALFRAVGDRVEKA